METDMSHFRRIGLPFIIISTNGKGCVTLKLFNACAMVKQCCEQMCLSAIRLVWPGV